jgi:hypothetical protein
MLSSADTWLGFYGFFKLKLEIIEYHWRNLFPGIEEFYIWMGDVFILCVYVFLDLRISFMQI